MVLLRNNFDGGPDGTTLTVGNSGQYGNDAFDSVNSTGPGSVIRFTQTETLNRPTAEFALEMDTGNSLVTPRCSWVATLGTQAELWARVYVRFSSITYSAAGEPFNILAFFNLADATKGVVIGLDTTITPSLLYLTNLFTGGRVDTGIQPSVGVWTRLECHVLMGTTGGVADLYLYDGDAADGDLPTEVVGLTGQNLGASSVDVATLGQSVNAKRNMDPIFYSNWEVNSTGYPGPAPYRAGKGVPGILTNPIAPHVSVA